MEGFRTGRCGLIKKVVGEELRLAVGTQTPILVNYDLVVMNLSTQRSENQYSLCTFSLPLMSFIWSNIPHLLYCKWQNLGRGVGTRLAYLFSRKLMIRNLLLITPFMFLFLCMPGTAHMLVHNYVCNFNMADNFLSGESEGQEWTSLVIYSYPFNLLHTLTNLPKRYVHVWLNCPTLEYSTKIIVVY